MNGQNLGLSVRNPDRLLQSMVDLCYRIAVPCDLASVDELAFLQATPCPDAENIVGRMPAWACRS